MKTLIRFILYCILIHGVYLETGWATASSMALTFFLIEIQTISVNRLWELVKLLRIR